MMINKLAVGENLSSFHIIRKNIKMVNKEVNIKKNEEKLQKQENKNLAIESA
jgi:hypothetical protein